MAQNATQGSAESVAAAAASGAVSGAVSAAVAGQQAKEKEESRPEGQHRLIIPAGRSYTLHFKGTVKSIYVDDENDETVPLEAKILSDPTNPNGVSVVLQAGKVEVGRAHALRVFIYGDRRAIKSEEKRAVATSENEPPSGVNFLDGSVVTGSVFKIATSGTPGTLVAINKTRATTAEWDVLYDAEVTIQGPPIKAYDIKIFKGSNVAKTYYGCNDFGCASVGR